ncbi:MAG TPA: AI-2E family transporter [Noviherbaspirillum sp.]|jgi:predicted PurR-regulated permease PerM|uniref:AI-2E family transporter n=1 Tax=Noviherbaspirillum sp. TaxID=1926288 RepID=UPI002DDCC3DE|nr:AI-2E family transporter [Noviherbaspirillum sp.]HEV2612076.1 AI-2E family transporter [Noviherbaspirillum sp.]
MAENDETQQIRQVNVEESGGVNRSLLLAITLFYAFGALFLLAIVTLWLASDILLLVFASILVAVFLSGTSNLLVQRFKLPPKLSLPTVLLLIGIAAGLGGYFLIPRISAQGAELMTTLPNSVERLIAYLSGYEWFRGLTQSMPPAQELLPGFSKILNQARIVFSGMFTFVAKLTIVLFVGVYLAAQPHLYVNGFLKLFPPRRRNRAREVLYEIGDTLKLWLIGKLIGMIIVGTATSLALGLLGVPLAVTLGLITGLLNFIPYLGPLIAGIPMVLIAFSQGPTLALYTMLFYVVLQLAESYLLTPFVDRRTVYLPPALTITVQVFMGIFFGLLGITLATPLAACVYVLIAMLYVQDVLNDSTTMPSER